MFENLKDLIRGRTQAPRMAIDPDAEYIPGTAPPTPGWSLSSYLGTIVQVKPAHARSYADIQYVKRSCKAINQAITNWHSCERWIKPGDKTTCSVKRGDAEFSIGLEKALEDAYRLNGWKLVWPCSPVDKVVTYAISIMQE